MDAGRYSSYTQKETFCADVEKTAAKSRILPLVLRLVALPSAFSFETIVFSTSGITIETT